jgi:hypothetical protein
MAQQMRELMTPNPVALARHRLGARGRPRHAGRRDWRRDCH